MNKAVVHSGKVARSILIANIIMAVIYFSWWFLPGHVGNPILYYLLLFGEVYHILMALTFWHTIWPRRVKRPNQTFPNISPSVDVFITVAGEPIDVVRETVMAAKSMKYPHHQIYILNDGFVAKKLNWQDMESLADDYGIHCITRKTPGGAKAGNINNALSQTSGEIVVIFDADMVPHADFLEKMIPYFSHPKTGFVQSPQYYVNHPLNQVTGGAWEQQELFFGPIMAGKARNNAAFICGTNVAIRRSTLLQVGGMNEHSIAEDFLTSLAIHQKGWHSYYVSEVLAEGLAPEDLLSYYKQQLRWARGSLEVLFGQNPLFKGGLSWHQKVEYLSSALYYFNGVILFIDMLMPLIFLFSGIQPVAATTTSFALFFIPFMFLNLYTLFLSSDGQITFRAISFSQASWTLQLQALRSILLRQKMGFAVTPKHAQSGNFLFLAFPHLTYIGLALLASVVGLHREGINPSIITNVAWAFFNIFMFLPFITASINAKGGEERQEVPQKAFR